LCARSSFADTLSVCTSAEQVRAVRHQTWTWELERDAGSGRDGTGGAWGGWAPRHGCPDPHIETVSARFHGIVAVFPHMICGDTLYFRALPFLLSGLFTRHIDLATKQKARHISTVVVLLRKCSPHSLSVWLWMCALVTLLLFQTAFQAFHPIAALLTIVALSSSANVWSHAGIKPNPQNDDIHYRSVSWGFAQMLAAARESAFHRFPVLPIDALRCALSNPRT
jgi:hypothetical protein